MQQRGIKRNWFSLYLLYLLGRTCIFAVLFWGIWEIHGHSITQCLCTFIKSIQYLLARITDCKSEHFCCWNSNIFEYIAKEPPFCFMYASQTYSVMKGLTSTRRNKASASETYNKCYDNKNPKWKIIQQKMTLYLNHIELLLLSVTLWLPPSSMFLSNNPFICIPS